MYSFKRALLASLSSLLLLVAPVSAQDSLQSSNTQAPLDKYQWSYDTDPYGSEAIINHKLIIHGGIWIKFKRRQAQPLAHLRHSLFWVLRQIFERHILNALMNGRVANILNILDELQRSADNAAIAK